MGNSPKRRKSKDNPYAINHNEVNNTYIVVFNSNNKEEKVNVSKEVYDAFNSFELIDLKQLNEMERHYDSNEATEEYIYRNSIVKNDSVEDIVEKKIMSEKLQKAIKELPELQKRRLVKYYFENKTFEQIALEENCTKMAVKFTIDIAIEKISKKFKN